MYTQLTTRRPRGGKASFPPPTFDEVSGNIIGDATGMDGACQMSAPVAFSRQPPHFSCVFPAGRRDEDKAQAERKHKVVGFVKALPFKCGKLNRYVVVVFHFPPPPPPTTPTPPSTLNDSASVERRLDLWVSKQLFYGGRASCASIVTVLLNIKFRDLR